MTAAEMGLDHDLDYFRMKAAEMEEAEKKLNVVLDTIDNQMQTYRDYNYTPGYCTLYLLRGVINGKLGKEE